MRASPDEVPALSALLAARHGYIVFERYYGGQDPETPDQRALGDQERHRHAGRGRAAARSAATGSSRPWARLIPERIPDGADPRVADITLWQWLTMTSGLQWDAHGDWQRLLAAPDWVAMTLGLPVVGVPGETYVYNTGGSHVLGVTVAKAAGKPLEDYAEDVLFRPLGITPGDWMRSPQGEVSAGSGLELTPRDMLKLGLLYLRNGEWDGEQIIDRRSTRPPRRPGRAPGTRPAAGPATAISGGSRPRTPGIPPYFALGYGGQHIFVVPALDLVVVAAIARRRGPGGAANPALSDRVDRGGVPPSLRR